MIRQRVAIVFQDPDDQLFMQTVWDDVAFGPANLGLRGAELAARVERALAAVGMEGVADRPPHHLSYGQRRRVAVVTVLAMEPDILVLDEPSSNLDPAARRELADVLRGLDLTMLMVTHDLPYALELCPRAVVMNDGVIVADGPTNKVLADAELMRANRLELPYGFDPSSPACASHSPSSRRPDRRHRPDARERALEALGGGVGSEVTSAVWTVGQRPVHTAPRLARTSVTPLRRSGATCSCGSEIQGQSA